MAYGLVAITIDHLPAWILPPYGATWVSAPAFNAIAARGLVFDRVVADSADPMAVAARLVPFRRCGRVDLVTDDDAFARSVEASLATSEKPGGTVVAVSDPDRRPEGKGREGLRSLFARVARMASLPGAEGVLWCHVSALGHEWSAPSAYRERYRDPEDPPGLAGRDVPRLAVDDRTDPDTLASIRHAFAGELTHLDECVGATLTAIEAAGGRPPLLLMAGVRGMALGLHGWVGPTDASAMASVEVAPYGEVVDLPVIVVDPEGRMAAQRFAGLVGPEDVASVVEEVVFGRRVEREPSPSPLLGGLFEDWSVAARESIVARFASALSVTTPEWRLILREKSAATGGARRAELYAKPDDYFEMNDVADRCGEVVEALSAIATAAAVSATSASGDP